MMAQVRKRVQPKGQSIAEFALTFLLLLIFLFIILDVGRVTYYYTAIIHSSREAARYGIVNPNDYYGMAKTAQDNSFGIDPNDLTITASSSEDDGTVMVLVQYTFVPASPVLGMLFGTGGTFPLEARSTMQIEK